MRNKGVGDNFTLFFDAQVETFREELIRKLDCNQIEYKRIYGNKIGNVAIQFINTAGKGSLNCPISCDNLENPEEGAKHFNRQKNDYQSTITLHPELKVRDLTYLKPMSDIIIQIGEFAIDKRIPICIPSPGRETFKFENDKFDFDYSKIVYHQP